MLGKLRKITRKTRTLNCARRGRGMRRVARLAVRVAARRGIDRSRRRLPSDWQFTSFSATNTQELGTVFRRPLVLNSPTNWESATKISNVSSQIIKHRSDTQRGRAPTFAINPDFAVASRVPLPRELAPSPTPKKPSATRPCLSR